ncbi:MAG TPA: hypothetical protein VLJ10_05635 [Candidatus Bathyarchaeia archaeon]|nr:hypothetical protein [Candidatus Bathyarchaeia archaeon]
MNIGRRFKIYLIAFAGLMVVYIFKGRLDEFLFSVSRTTISSSKILPVSGIGNPYFFLLGSCLVVAVAHTLFVAFFRKQRLTGHRVFKIFILNFLSVFVLLGLAQFFAISSSLWNSNRKPYGEVQAIVDDINTVKTRYGQHCPRISFVTDISLGVDPGMFLQRLWRYHLLPIKLSGPANEESVECILYFEKENYEQAVPDNYVIVERFSGVQGLAVRKDVADAF